MLNCHILLKAIHFCPHLNLPTIDKLPKTSSQRQPLTWPSAPLCCSQKADDPESHNPLQGIPSILFQLSVFCFAARLREMA